MKKRFYIQLFLLIVFGILGIGVGATYLLGLPLSKTPDVLKFLFLGPGIFITYPLVLLPAALILLLIMIILLAQDVIEGMKKPDTDTRDQDEMEK